MRILADENVPRLLVQALRADGHDVAWVMEDSRRSPDHVVLNRAQSEDRLLVTFDKDFGELAFRHRLPASSGIVLIRATTSSPQQLIQLVTAAFTSRTDWPGNFSVVDHTEIRMTPLPVGP